LLRSDEDAIYGNDFERIQTLLEEMNIKNVKDFEAEIKRFLKGNIPEKLENEYDLVCNNPFY
jgi:hypothetical protein